VISTGRRAGRAADWLDEARAALDEAAHPCLFFFRDDDVGWGHERLYALLDVFAAHGVPVDLAVVPTALDDLLRRALTTRARAAQVRLHQHGLAHLNHEPAGRECEFGPSRDVAALTDDLLAGRYLLLDAFGELLDPVFTPPWNRCAPELGDVLVAAGVEVLSRDADARPLDHPGLAEIPVTLDWSIPRHEVGGRLADGIRSGEPVGLMLHHAATDDAGLADLDALLELVEGHPRAVPTSIDAVHLFRQLG
jgi:hypothetical protein